ncbi:MAG: hypothetical protein QM536_08830 [Chitinophagaceae bacterium]|nr:hypothetical protein [Chitinophagaceae bacterium]
MKHLLLLLVLFITSCGVKNYGFFHNRYTALPHNEKGGATEITKAQKDTSLGEEKTYYPTASLSTDYIPLPKRKQKNKKTTKTKKITDTIIQKESCDIIFLHNGISFFAIVTQKTPNTIVYRKCNPLSESQEVISALEVQYIQYHDKKKDSIENVFRQQKIEHSIRMEKLTRSAAILSALPIPYSSIIATVYYFYQQGKRTPEQKVLDKEIAKTKKIELFGVFSFASFGSSILPLILGVTGFIFNDFYYALLYLSLATALSLVSIGLGIKSIINLRKNRETKRGWGFVFITLFSIVLILFLSLLFLGLLLSKI